MKDNQNTYHTIWNCKYLVFLLFVGYLKYDLVFFYLYFAVAHAIGFAPERKALPVLITLSLYCTVRTFLWQMNWTLQQREQYKHLQVDPLVFFQYVLQTRLFRRKVFLLLFNRGRLLIWFWSLTPKLSRQWSRSYCIFLDKRIDGCYPMVSNQELDIQGHKMTYSSLLKIRIQGHLFG